MADYYRTCLPVGRQAGLIPPKAASGIDLNNYSDTGILVHMRSGESHRSLLFWFLAMILVPILISGVAGDTIAESSPAEEKKGFSQKLGFLSPRKFYGFLRDGDNRLFEALFRPLEFREPIISIPIEGRYGVGFYGWEKFNPFKFDSTLITYEPGTLDIIDDVGLSSRTGSFIEFEVIQTNLSYIFFKKSYLDFLTGFGFRYSSIFPFPTIDLTDKMTISGPPEVPSSWGVKKKFSPTVIEGNVVTSLIMQWSPKWFLHFKYSYGLNRTRFYRGNGNNDKPFGTGSSSTVSIGIKYIRESETAARYAWGLELRHIYHKVGNIRDPDEHTPISGFHLPSLGLFFTFGAFYGGQSTVGDEGKKLFLKKDYVSARPKIDQFVNDYPNHARIERAQRLLQLCIERIPEQLYHEGKQLTNLGENDQALGKFVEASLTANEDLEKRLHREIDKIVERYLDIAEGLFEERKDDEAIRSARKAAAVSEHGREYQRMLEGRIYLRQGEDLAFQGFYPMALRKLSEALKLAPSLKEDIRRVELEVVVGMLEDVNKTSDEGSLRLALHSLYQVREILGKSDSSMDGIIDQLESQLSLLDEIRLKQGMDNVMNEGREEIARRHAPKVELGMLVAEIQAILGDPHEVVEHIDQKRKYQMWIYYQSNKHKKLLYFEDYVLYKVEEE